MSIFALEVPFYHHLYQIFFDKSSVCKTLKTGLVLTLFKGKGAKANNKDNYRGITLFPTLCKISCIKFTYINSLPKELSDHCFAISINTLRMPAPSFADDICLIALHQSLLKILMHNYSKTWRYELNHSKSGVVTFGKSKPLQINHRT